MPFGRTVLAFLQSPAEPRMMLRVWFPLLSVIGAHHKSDLRPCHVWLRASAEGPKCRKSISPRPRQINETSQPNRAGDPSTRAATQLRRPNLKSQSQEPLSAPFLNGLFSGKSGKNKTLQMVTLQVKIQLFFFVLGNFGAGGKQEHGRELCAEFLWLFARVQFSLAVLPFAVFLFCPSKFSRGQTAPQDKIGETPC